MGLAKTLFLVSVTAVVLFSGCRVVEEPIAVEDIPATRLQAPQEPAAAAAAQGDPAIGSRFEPAAEQVTSVQSVVAWSQRYDDLSKKNEQLMASNNSLLLENNELKQKLVKLQSDLETTMTELEDANKFMQEMHGELTKWKGDVLGFREEMRSAQTTELQALAKILSILGAEPVGTSSDQDLVSQK